MPVNPTVKTCTHIKVTGHPSDLPPSAARNSAISTNA